MAKFSNQNIAEAIDQVLKDKAGAEYSQAQKNVVQFLARRRLFSQAPQILSRLEKIMDERQGVLRARLASARTLSTASRGKLEQFLKRHYRAKKIVFDAKIEEELLGGVRVEVGDEVLDLTLRQKIKKLKEHLLAS